jgi:FKBP-type peptidyl-prolyl cis-trans isomerase (trigger factor)
MRPDMSNHVQVRVQVPGKATQKVFDEALVILARDAPPVPGFRKSKGGTDTLHSTFSFTRSMQYLFALRRRNPDF